MELCNWLKIHELYSGTMRDTKTISNLYSYTLWFGSNKNRITGTNNVPAVWYRKEIILAQCAIYNK